MAILRRDAAQDPVAFRLSRHDDPTCCPTGGRAEARLALAGDRLVLRDAAILPAQ